MGYFEEKKCEILLDAFHELSETIYAFDLSREKIESQVLIESIQVTKKKPIFSNFRKLLRGEHSQELDDLLEKRSSPIFDYVRLHQKECDFFESDFQYSDDPDEFELEFHVLSVLFRLMTRGEIELIQSLLPDGFVLPGIDDPRVDIAIMKGLLQAGKMIMRMRHEGIPAKAGGTDHKGYVPKEDIIQAAKEVSKDMRGRKTQRSMTTRVIKRLRESEAKNANPKKVYDFDYMRQEILKDAWPELL